MAVLVYSENKNVGFELIAKAKELSKEVTAVVVGKKNEDIAKEYVSYGADKVIVVKTSFDSYKAEEYADIFKEIVSDVKADTILIGSDKNGKELASRLAGMLDAGCVIDAVKVYEKDNKLTAERVVYSGNAISVEQFNQKPAILTIPSKVFDPLEKDDTRKGEIIKKDIKAKQSPSKITNIAETKSDGVNVEDADIIVSCGRGFKNKDDIKYASELANVLKGKTVGCSRPIAADLKWLPEEHWIGLSGHKVKPQLYIAAGISGQIQHIAGMRDSGVVVAINKDPEALIFNSADYGIVGDLYSVLPKLTDALKKKMG
jgi:electron transfer flavoprotein alpha subunit